MEESKKTEMSLITKSMRPNFFKSGTEKEMQEQNLGGQAILQTRIDERKRESENRRERQEVADESKKQREKVNASEHQIL